jgi:hypothetical protein
MKLVKESLYEKFTEDDSDPISDMNIGVGNLEKLKIGDIIRAKCNLSLGNNSILYRRSFVFRHIVDFIYKKQYCVINGVKYYKDENNIDMCLINFCTGTDHLDIAKKLRDNLLTYAKLAYTPYPGFTFLAEAENLKKWFEFVYD